MSKTIEPFVEASTTRPTPSSSVGIDTSDIDAFRQGVSLRTDRHRFIGTLPKAWSGDLTHQHQQLTLGVENLWYGYTPHDDTRRDLTSGTLIDHFLSGASGGVTVIKAFGKFGDDDGDIEMFNGVIEPLEIRTVVSGVHPLTASLGHGVGGSFAEGSRGDPISQWTSTRDVNVAEPFVDVGSTTLAATASYTSTSGFLSGTVVQRAELVRYVRQVEQRQSPFDDSVYVNPRLPKSYLSGTRANFFEQMQQLSSSTDVFELEHRRFSGTGITYHSTKFGTDSLAFGGLGRYKVP